MVRVTTRDRGADTGETLAEPYPASWFDRTIDGVQQLPGPPWLVYVGAWVVLFLLETAVKWRDGAYPAGTFLPVHAVLAGFGFYFLALMHYLDDLTGQAIASLRPVITVSDAEYATLQYQLTTAPARPTLLASMIGAFLLIPWLVTLPVETYKLFTSPWATVLDLLIGFFAWATMGAMAYHTVHQLRIVSHIHTRCTRINLFHCRPLYALSRLTALTAVGLLLPAYAWFATAPGALTRPLELVVAAGWQLIAVTAFIWPLMGVHSRLVKEKERLQAEVAEHQAATIAEVYRRIEAGEFEDVEGISQMLVASIH